MDDGREQQQAVDDGGRREGDEDPDDERRVRAQGCGHRECAGTTAGAGREMEIRTASAGGRVRSHGRHGGDRRKYEEGMEGSGCGRRRTDENQNKLT